MKNKRMFLAVALGMITVVSIAWVAIAQAAGQSTNNRQEKLLGSWNVEAATPGQGTFPALLTFSADGSVIADESPNPFESSGHGNWDGREHGEIAYTFVALFGGQDGKNTGKLKVIGTLQFDARRDRWTGPFTIDVFDASGQVIFTDRGTFSLTRIAIESLR